MSFHLRPATSADAPFLAQLFCEVRSAEFAPLNLPAPALQQLLDLQHRAQFAGYAEQFPHAESLIICLAADSADSPDSPGPAEILTGRLLLDRTPTHIQLIDIAIAARFRGQGIGTQVLTGLCAQAAAAALPIRLTVRAGNPAARLYQRLGFLPTAADAVNITMEFHPAPHRTHD